MSFLKSLARTIAPIALNVLLPGVGGAVAIPLVDKIARTVAGEPDAPMDQVEKKIQADPQLLVAYKKSLMDHEEKLAQLEVDLGAQDVEALAVVNETMQVEVASEKWPQYAWRPFNGFLFGPTVVYIYAVLPTLDKVVPTVPQVVWVFWGAILGVTAWGRNRLKERNNLQPGPGPGEIIGGFIKKAINRKK